MTTEQQQAAKLVALAERTYDEIRDAWLHTPMTDGARYDRLNRIRSRAWQRVRRRRETQLRLLYGKGVVNG
jgi:hypothetical protein